MTSGMRTVIYPVKDLEKAKAVYSNLLGADPVMDEPYYVGYRIGEQDVGLDPNGHAQGMTGPVGYWHVDDIKASLETLLDAGGETVKEVTDVGGGKLVASAKDADGNVVGLLQMPWDAERTRDDEPAVDVRCRRWSAGVPAVRDGVPRAVPGGS